MERELCLVLDEKGEERLVLESGSKYQIDEYTSKYFESSREIREAYSEEIKEFLEKNNTNYPGRIVIVIPENIGKEVKNYQRKVLYKKHIVAFKEFTKSRVLMIKFSEYQKKKSKEKKLVSDYFCDIIQKPWTRKNAVKTYINEWLKSERKKAYYDIIRDMMLVYEEEMQKRNLLTIDELYIKYKQEKEQKAKERIKKRGEMKLQKTNHTIVENSVVIEEDSEFYVNGSKYTIDELHLFDLCDIDDTSTYIPDGLKRR